MTDFTTSRLPRERDIVATDGSDVRILQSLSRGALAHFTLAPGQTSTAVMHRTVEEIWYFLSGRGEMWHRQDSREEVAPVEAGVCVTIPLGTHFQFRSLGDEPLVALASTMPPWPGDGGRWSCRDVGHQPSPDRGQVLQTSIRN
jgi:mannose-6-phosphate isomerase-like protein (cupin superfamily)